MKHALDVRREEEQGEGQNDAGATFQYRSGSHEIAHASLLAASCGDRVAGRDISSPGSLDGSAADLQWAFTIVCTDVCHSMAVVLVCKDRSGAQGNRGSTDDG